MIRPGLLVLVFAMSLWTGHAWAKGGASSADVARDVSVEILSTNLANSNTKGEWGLSALVRADGNCILFDAGYYPDTVIHNAKALGVDLACIDTIVLSHFHFDHTGGLETLVKEITRGQPGKTIKTFVAEGFFLPRWLDTAHPAGAAMARQFGGPQWNQMIAQKAVLEDLGLEFVEVAGPTQIEKGVWVTGPIKRRHAEKNYPPISRLSEEGENSHIDHVPDSQGLVIRTSDGPIILVGCGHAGAVNLVEQVSEDIQAGPVLALMGGLHLFNATDETLAWTGKKLGETGVQYLMAGHCTGVHPMYALRDALGLDRRTAVIGAVGARFELGHGIHATPIVQ